MDDFAISMQFTWGGSIYGLDDFQDIFATFINIVIVDTLDVLALAKFPFAVSLGDVFASSIVYVSAITHGSAIRSVAQFCESVALWIPVLVKELLSGCLINACPTMPLSIVFLIGLTLVSCVLACLVMLCCACRALNIWRAQRETWQRDQKTFTAWLLSPSPCLDVPLPTFTLTMPRVMGRTRLPAHRRRMRSHSIDKCADHTFDVCHQHMPPCNFGHSGHFDRIWMPVDHAWSLDMCVSGACMLMVYFMYKWIRRQLTGAQCFGGPRKQSGQSGQSAPEKHLTHSFQPPPWLSVATYRAPCLDDACGKSVITNNCTSNCMRKSLVDSRHAATRGHSARQLKRVVLRRAIKRAAAIGDVDTARQLARLATPRQWANALAICAAADFLKATIVVDDGCHSWIIAPSRVSVTSPICIQHRDQHFEAISRHRGCRPNAKELDLHQGFSTTLSGGAKRRGRECHYTFYHGSRTYHLHVPEGYTRDQCVEAAAERLGFAPQWCAATWTKPSHFVVRCACMCHSMCSFTSDRLQGAIAKLPMKPSPRALAGIGKFFAAGLRATRQKGVMASAKKAENKLHILELNLLMRTSLHATWSAFQVLQHKNVPAHQDRMDQSLAFMTTISGPKTVLEHHTKLGEQLFHDTRQRWVAFDPTLSHQVHVDDDHDAVSIVVYTPCRESPACHNITLHALGFPLGEGSLDATEVPCEQASDPPTDSDCGSDLESGTEQAYDDMAVRFPEIDAGTGVANVRSAPSWTYDLGHDQIASRKTNLVMFLLQKSQVPVRYWHEFIKSKEDTADAIFNARTRFQLAKEKTHAGAVWHAVLEREERPAGSEERYQFRTWLKLQDQQGWICPTGEVEEVAAWRRRLYRTYVDEFFPTPALRPPLAQSSSCPWSPIAVPPQSTQSVPIEERWSALPSRAVDEDPHDAYAAGSMAPDANPADQEEEDHEPTFTFDPMNPPPVQSLPDVGLSATLPDLLGGAIDDDGEYQKTLKKAVAARPKQVSAAQVKLLTRGVPGLLNKLKKANIEEQLAAAISKAASDVGLTPKAGASQSASQSSTQQPSANNKPSSNGDGSAQQRSKSANLPRKDRDGSNRRSTSASSNGNRVSFEESASSAPQHGEKSTDGAEAPPFHSLCAEEWNVPVLEDLLMEKPGVVAAWSQKHAQQIAAACVGTKHPAAFIYSSPIQTIDRVTPVAFLAKRKQDGDFSLFHAFLHQLGPASMPVTHIPRSTHVKRSTSVSIAVMIVDFSDSCTPQDCDVEDLKSVRSWLQRLAQSTSQRLTLVDTFHLTQSTCGTTVKIRVMADQVESWMRRGTPSRCFPRPLGPALESYVSYFDKQLSRVEQAEARYASVDGFIGITVKQGEVWGAIFAKDSADKAAVALGKPPGQTFRVSGLGL
eukprot:6488648-Amphidinium_carterae.1